MKILNRDHIRCIKYAQNYSLRECIWVVALSCLVLYSGCASHEEAQATQQAVEKISNNEAETSQAMQASRDVLGRMHFEIEKADIQNGYIRTRPLAGAQFFEFWRNDNVGLKNQLLSNLHSIRRVVELNIGRLNGELRIDCKVHVQRLSIPQREITSSAQAYQMFTRSNISLQRLEMNPEQEAAMVWIELDHDKKLEEEILKRIDLTIKRENKETDSKAKTVKDKL